MPSLYTLYRHIIEKFDSAAAKTKPIQNTNTELIKWLVFLFLYVILSMSFVIIINSPYTKENLMQQIPQTIHPKREDWADSLKGLAMCGVLLIHSGANSLPGIIGKIGTLGQHGTQLFFILSAYFAWHSIAHAYEAMPAESPFSVTLFWWKRKLKSLLPVYYLALIIYLLLRSSGESYWLGSHSGISLLNIASHFLLLHGFNPYYINSILGIEWYLADLAVFLFLSPFLYRMIRNFEQSVYFFLFSAAGSCLLYFLSTSWIPQKDSYLFQAYFQTFWFVTQLPVFSAGITLYFLLDKLQASDSIHNKALSSYCLLFAAAVMLTGEALNINHIFGITKYVLLAVCFSGLILSQYLHPCPLLCNRISAAVGKRSYPIYLFHWLLLKIYESKISLSVGNPVCDWLIRFLLVLLASFITALFIEVSQNIFRSLPCRLSR